jgi:hypothetical protein
MDRDLGVALSLDPAIRRLIRSNLLELAIAQPEKVGVAAQNVRAGKSPDPLGRRVEMVHTVIAVDDDDGIAGLFKRCEQEFGCFNRGAVVDAHRLTLGS